MSRAMFLIVSVFVGILALAGAVGIAVGISAAVGGGASAPGQLSPPGRSSAPGQLSPPRGMSGPGGVAGNNLVDNPSFEQELKGWQFVQVTGNNLSGIDDTTAHTGKRSFRETTNITCDPLTGTIAGDWWYLQGANAIPVTAGGTYSVSSWYLKSEGGGIGVGFYYGGAALAQPVLQSPAVEVRQLPGQSAEVIPHNGASTAGVLPHHGPPATGDWAQIGFDFPVPPGVTAVRVFLGNGALCDALFTTHSDDVALMFVR